MFPLTSLVYDNLWVRLGDYLRVENLKGASLVYSPALLTDI